MRKHDWNPKVNNSINGNIESHFNSVRELIGYWTVSVWESCIYSLPSTYVRIHSSTQFKVNFIYIYFFLIESFKQTSALAELRAHMLKLDMSIRVDKVFLIEVVTVAS